MSYGTSIFDHKFKSLSNLDGKLKYLVLKNLKYY